MSPGFPRTNLPLTNRDVGNDTDSKPPDDDYDCPDATSAKTDPEDLVAGSHRTHLKMLVDRTVGNTAVNHH